MEVAGAVAVEPVGTGFDVARGVFRGLLEVALGLGKFARWRASPVLLQSGRVEFKKKWSY